MKLLPLLLGLALASCASTRDQHSIFGAPLYVDGKRVTDDQIKLALIYGPCQQKLEDEKTRLIVDYELARQARDKAEAEVDARAQQTPFASSAERADFKEAARARIAKELAARYEVSDAELEAEYEYNIDDFRKSFPTLDLDTEVRRSFRSIPWYREHLRQDQSFDRVFLPDDPAEWPTTTIESLRADASGGDVFLGDAQESYLVRLKASESNGGKLPREDDMFMGFMREIVRNSVLGVITIKTQANGLDPKLALWADLDSDGKPERTLTIEELWKQVRETVTEAEIEEAKRWFVTSGATRARLEREDGLLDPADSRTSLAELERSPERGTSSVADLATKTYEFPSLESFAEYYALRSGFERLIATQLVDGPQGELSAELTAYLHRADYTLGMGRVDVEVLLISAQGIPRFSWTTNSWEQARRSARTLLAQYERNPNPECWSDLLDRYSEFCDIPSPQPHDGLQTIYCYQPMKKGRFGSVMYGDLMSRLAETPYTEWVTGECIADHICFEQEENSIAGPFRGPLGWYLTRLTKRSHSPRPFQVYDPQFRKLLKEDYVRWAFIQYSKEAVAQADIRGWEPL